MKERIIIVSHIQGPFTNRFKGNGSSVNMVSEFQSCGRSNRSEYLANTNSFFGFGKMDHEIRDFVLRFL